VNILVAFVCMWLVANLPLHYLMRTAVPVYVFGMVLLIAVALFGEISHGARRWLNLGVMTIQPSELMKIGVPLMMAWYFERHEATLTLKNYFVATLLLLMPILLIARQHGFGYVAADLRQRILCIIPGGTELAGDGRVVDCRIRQRAGDVGR